MTTGTPVLETPRLILRPLQAEDFEGWAALMQDEEAARFLGGTQHPAVAWRAFLAMAGAWTIQGFSMFSVIEKATGRWIGRIGPCQPLGWPGTEVGWTIIRERWGKGYAVEGATAAIDWAFQTLGWTKMIHCIAPANTPSQAVARKLGSTLLGPGRLPPPREEAVIDLWGQTREQWLARRK